MVRAETLVQLLVVQGMCNTVLAGDTYFEEMNGLCFGRESEFTQHSYLPEGTHPGDLNCLYTYIYNVISGPK